jgi:predicted O-linked N-acetylglucosamine transferase (SPINDLY family)
MATKSTGGKTDFPGAGGAIDAKTREVFNGAIDAMAEWREEMAGSTERYSKKVFDKMGVAARAMGWPEELIQATREQMEHAAKLQMHMLDQVMDAWQDQMKAPSSGAFLERMTAGKESSFPGMEAFQQMMSQMQGMPGMSGLGMAPLQFWMQAAEMWQKSWASAMSMWMSNFPGMSGMPGMPGFDPKDQRWK